MRLAVKAGLGVGQVFAGQDDLLLHDHRLAAALWVALGAKGHRATALLGGARLGAFVHHAHFQRGRTAQNVLGLGGVLHAGQLHHDAIQALLLDHGLGHTQFVDPVVQRDDVLLDGLLLHLASGLGLDAGAQAQAVAIGLAHHLQVGKLVGNDVAHRVLGGFVRHLDVDGLAVTRDAAVAHIFLTQRGADVTGISLGLLGEGRLHVHLQHEVHAAPQVQPQEHGAGMDGTEPRGGA